MPNGYTWFMGGRGLKAYVTGASPHESWVDKPVLVLAHDIFGPSAGRHYELADYWAKELHGICVVPDYFHGSRMMAEDPGMGPWAMVKIIIALITGTFKAFVKRFTSAELLADTEVLHKFLDARGVEKFGMVGFCWGAFPLFKVAGLAGSRPKLVCCASFHPSVMGVAKELGENCEEIVQQAVASGCAQMVVATPMEPKEWQPDGSVQKMLVSGLGEAAVSFTATTQQHGYMTRGDTTKPAVLMEVEKSIREVISFVRPRLSAGKGIVITPVALCHVRRAR